MERMIRRLKATPRAPGVEEIYYPGELEARAAARAARQGVALPAATVEELNEQARRLGIPVLA